MDVFSNRIQPLIQKIRNNDVMERVIGKSEETESMSNNFDLSECQPERCASIVTGYWSYPNKSTPNRYAQTRQLGRLNPSLYLSEESEELYEITPGHLGRMWFTVCYSKANELLKVTIHKIRNLRSNHVTSRASLIGNHEDNLASASEDNALQDFRVRLFLDQAERKYHTTAIKKQTVNPNFNESFCFQVAYHDLNLQSLRLHVLGFDKRRRCRLIGYVAYPLTSLADPNLDEKELRIYRDIKSDTQDENSGNPQLLIALTYFPLTERLIVGLFKCRNLPLRDNGLPVDVCAKVVVYQGLHGKELKSKRTEWLGTKDTFGESFSFNRIPDPTNVNVRITLLQHGFMEKQVGFVVLGNEMVSKGRGVTHWQSMMERPEEQVCEWQELQLL